MAARRRSAISFVESSALKYNRERGPPNTLAPRSGRPEAHAKAQVRSHVVFARAPGATIIETAPRIRSVPCNHSRFRGTSGRSAIETARGEFAAGALAALPSSSAANASTMPVSICSLMRCSRIRAIRFAQSLTQLDASCASVVAASNQMHHVTPPCRRLLHGPRAWPSCRRLIALPKPCRCRVPSRSA